MKKIQLMAFMALALTFAACNQQTTSNSDEQATPDSTMIETPADEVRPAELTLTAKGIEGVLELGVALEGLPAQVEGLYDKVTVQQVEDEGETMTVVDFTLADKTVMTGGSNNGKTLDNLDIAAGPLTLRSGDKTWHMGDKPDGLSTNEYGQHILDGITILTDDNRNINQMLVGTF